MPCLAPMLGTPPPMHLAPCGVRRLAAAVCGRGSPRPLLVRPGRHGFLCVGARHAVPGDNAWHDAAHSSSLCFCCFFVGERYIVPSADPWREAAHAPRTMWSAAACRRCLWARLASPTSRSPTAPRFSVRRGTACRARQTSLARRRPCTSHDADGGRLPSPPLPFAG